MDNIMNNSSSNFSLRPGILKKDLNYFNLSEGNPYDKLRNIYSKIFKKFLNNEFTERTDSGRILYPLDVLSMPLIKKITPDEDNICSFQKYIVLRNFIIIDECYYKRGDEFEIAYDNINDQFHLLKNDKEKVKTSLIIQPSSFKIMDLDNYSNSNYEFNKNIDFLNDYIKKYYDISELDKFANTDIIALLKRLSLFIEDSQEDVARYTTTIMKQVFIKFDKLTEDQKNNYDYIFIDYSEFIKDENDKYFDNYIIKLNDFDRSYGYFNKEIFISTEYTNMTFGNIPFFTDFDNRVDKFYFDEIRYDSEYQFDIEVEDFETQFNKIFNK